MGNEYVELFVKIEGTAFGTTKTMKLKGKSGELSEDFKDKLWADHHVDVDDL